MKLLLIIMAMTLTLSANVSPDEDGTQSPYYGERMYDAWRLMKLCEPHEKFSWYNATCEAITTEPIWITEIEAVDYCANIGMVFDYESQSNAYNEDLCLEMEK